MDRLTLTTEQAAFVAAKRAELGVQPGDPIQAGTNLVQDDTIRINDSWTIYVVCGDAGVIGAYVPEWDNMPGNVEPHFYCPIDVGDDVTDRAGPDGQTMPIYDAVALEARAAKKAGGANPKKARKLSDHDARVANRDLLAGQTDKHARQAIRAAMRAHGLLGKDD